MLRQLEREYAKRINCDPYIKFDWYIRFVAARVWCYGRIVEHETGFRSEYQRIEELHYYSQFTTATLDDAKNVAEKYSVPLVDHTNHRVPKEQLVLI
jgi:hypothetical protein